MHPRSHWPVIIWPICPHCWHCWRPCKLLLALSLALRGKGRTNVSNSSGGTNGEVHNEIMLLALPATNEMMDVQGGAVVTHLEQRFK